jgi:Na+/H+ antiporter NhaD/arsenite permease-like protein
VDNGIGNPNETIVDIWDSVVATQEQWDVVPTDKQPVDDSVAVADKAVVMVAEVVMGMVAVVQRLQHLLAIKDVVVACCQLTMLVVLVDVEHNRVLEDLSSAVGRGAPLPDE